MALILGESMAIGPVLSVPDGEPTEKVETEIALSVEYVKVIGPPDRDEDSCSIYGYIRVSDSKKAFVPAVTLFDRSRDEAETFDLGDREFQFLTLSDDASARPLLGGSPLYIQMKLWEKLPLPEDEKVEDPVIVDVDFEFDDMYKTNKRMFFKFEGDSGFVFFMAHAHIFAGVSAEIRFSVIKNIAAAGAEEVKAQAQLTGKRNHHLSSTLIYGTIGATQSINDDEMPAMQLFHASSDDPRQVDIGSPIELDRKLAVAPTSGGILGIGYTLYDVNGQLLTRNAVPFRIQNDAGFIRAPKHLTYKQEADHGVVSVSVTLIPYKRYN